MTHISAELTAAESFFPTLPQKEANFYEQPFWMLMKDAWARTYQERTQGADDTHIHTLVSSQVADYMEYWRYFVQQSLDGEGMDDFAEHKSFTKYVGETRIIVTIDPNPSDGHGVKLYVSTNNMDHKNTVVSEVRLQLKLNSSGVGYSAEPAFFRGYKKGAIQDGTKTYSYLLYELDMSGEAFGGRRAGYGRDVPVHSFTRESSTDHGPGILSSKEILEIVWAPTPSLDRPERNPILPS